MKRLFLFLSLFLIFFSENSRAENWQNVEFYGNGKIHKLSDYKGKVVLVMFWATWCPHCKNQMPALSMLKSLYSSTKTLEVLPISIDREGEQMVFNYFRTYNIKNLDPYIDKNSNLLHSLGLSAVPHLLLISKEGNVLGSYGGLQYLDVEYLEELISENGQSQ